MCRTPGPPPDTRYYKDRVRTFPYPWQKLVCFCKQEAYMPNLRSPKFTWHSHVATTCNICGKTEQWRLERCSVCNSPFIMDFRHPAYCIWDTHCWDCLEEVESDFQCPHKWNYELNYNPAKIPPVLTFLYNHILNPVDVDFNSLVPAFEL